MANVVNVVAVNSFFSEKSHQDTKKLAVYYNGVIVSESQADVSATLEALGSGRNAAISALSSGMGIPVASGVTGGANGIALATLHKYLNNGKYPAGSKA